MSEEDFKRIPVQGFVDIYKSLDNDRVRTPSRYTHFIKTFYKIFSTKKQTLLQRSNTLTVSSIFNDYRFSFQNKIIPNYILNINF